MDINNELQQINTFVKGMNTDVSDALMDSSQYRYAENVRLATNTDENTGELRLIEGNAQFPYNLGEIKAMTSIRNILIVVTKEDKIYKNEDGTGWSLVYKPAEGDTRFGDHLSLVTRWESDNNVKLYIADGAHELMYINIKNPSDNTLVGIDDILASTNQYMPPIYDMEIQSGGKIPYVKVLYTYRYYKMGGAASLMSPFSKIVTLYKSSSEGYGPDGAINNSIILNIPEIDDANYLQIYRIGYSQVGQLTQIDLIYDGEFINRYRDVGNNVLQLSNEEFDSLLSVDIKPAIIESKGDYLFAANIRDVQLETDEQLSIDMSSHSSGDIYNESTGKYNYNLQFNDISVYNIDYWKNENGLIGGDGKYISWQLVSNEIYIDTKNNRYKTSSDFPSNPMTNPYQDDIVSLRPGEVYRYGAILYSKYGKKSSVRWIADIMIPLEYDTPQYIISADDSNLHLYKFIRYGIKFYINWNALYEDCDICEHIEIVRAIRSMNDYVTISQGIGGYPVHICRVSYLHDDVQDRVEAKNAISPIGMLCINKFFIYGNDRTHYDDESSYYGQFGITDPQYLIYSTPEYCYQSDDIQDFIEDNKNALLLEYNYCLKSQLLNLLQAGYYQVKREIGDHTFRFAEQPISLLRAVLKDYLSQIGYTSSDTLFKDIVGYDDVSRDDLIAFVANPNETGAVKVSISCPKLIPADDNIYINSNVNAIGYSQTPRYDSLYSDDSFNGDGAISTISGDSSVYVNWTIPTLYENTDDTLYNFSLNQPYLNSEHALPVYPIGSSGKCIIFKTDDKSQLNYNDGNLTTPVISVKRNNVLPYNGESSIDTLSYISFGNVIDNNVSELDIYDGDCFPGIFVYNSSYTFDEPNLGSAIGLSNVYTVPIYSNIDLTATSGSLYTRLTALKKYYLLEKADDIHGFIQTLDMYMYRTEYTSESYTIDYPTIAYTDIDTGLFDTRVFHSNVKTNNEHIDSWLTFGQLNYIDVDSRFGLITDMRLFKDKLLFWQEHAVGILSVNERTILNDLNNNDIVLGTGGTLLRYDYISTVYGKKPHQYEAEVQSNYTQYWWDGYNKEILAYTGGIELTPLTKTKGLTNYINQREESDHPMLAYDTKYDEVLALVVADEVSNNTIVYNEQIQAFSSIYTFTPLYRTSVGNDLYLTDSNSIYLHNKQDIKNQSALFNIPIFPKVKIVVNKNNIYTKTFDNITFGGKMYNGSFIPLLNTPLGDTNGLYIEDKDHMNSPMHHLKFTFETPLKQQSSVRGDSAISVDEYDYRLAIPRNGSYATVQTIGDDIKNIERKIEYGNRMRGKTMQCEIASDYNSTDFSLQYITTKFRMSWS